MSFLLAYLHLTFDRSKEQGQGHAHFDNKYLGNGDRYGKNYVNIKYKVMYVPQIGILTFDLDSFEDQGQGQTHFYCEYLENSNR